MELSDSALSQNVVWFRKKSGNFRGYTMIKRIAILLGINWMCVDTVSFFLCFISNHDGNCGILAIGSFIATIILYDGGRIAQWLESVGIQIRRH